MINEEFLSVTILVDHKYAKLSAAVDVREPVILDLQNSIHNRYCTLLQEFFIQEECDTNEELDGSCNHFHIVNDPLCVR